MIHISDVLSGDIGSFLSAGTGPCYNPPYESPIEDDFAWYMAKYLDDATEFHKQVVAPTPWGNFRLDFVAVRFGVRIGFECDGAAYHKDDFRDECRDAAILKLGHVDAIYRLRGADLCHRTDAVVNEIAQHDGYLFSARGLTNLSRLAKIEDEARENWILPISTMVKRRTLEDRFLNRFALFLDDYPSGRLDDVIAAYSGKAA